MKILNVDIESTGLDHNHHEITQISGLVEVDGVIVDKFDIRMRPNYPERAAPQALEKTGMTIEKLMVLPPREEGWAEFKAILDKHIDRFDKTDKFYMLGYNVLFDKNFISALFKEQDEKYFGAYFFFEVIDVMPLAMLFRMSGKLDCKNLKLTTVCEALGIPFAEGTAHDGLYDIVQTVRAFKKMESRVTIT
jgi:DNA polymerase-3 subunit epsilon